MRHAFLTVTFLAALAGAASAQAGLTWNRGVANAHRLSLNGLPPGTRFLVEVEWYTTTNYPGATPIDVSTEITAMVNGVVVSSAHAIEELHQNGPNLGPCTGGGANGYCNPTPCAAYTNGQGQTIAGQCYHPVDLGCDCGRILSTVLPFNNTAIVTGDVITVVVAPAPGAVAELNTADDTYTFIVYADDPFTPECAGDGSLATPCPCANFGLTGHGCQNSVNPAGASLTASGSTTPMPGTTDDSVVLHGSGMPATSTAIYLKSDGYDPAGYGAGDGLFCVAGSIVRLRTKVNVGGASQFPEAGDPSLSVRSGVVPGSGAIAHYQVYYRNAANYCTPATSNTSSGMRIDW